MLKVKPRQNHALKAIVCVKISPEMIQKFVALVEVIPKATKAQIVPFMPEKFCAERMLKKEFLSAEIALFALNGVEAEIDETRQRLTKLLAQINTFLRLNHGILANVLEKFLKSLDLEKFITAFRDAVEIAKILEDVLLKVALVNQKLRNAVEMFLREFIIDGDSASGKAAVVNRREQHELYNIGIFKVALKTLRSNFALASAILNAKTFLKRRKIFVSQERVIFAENFCKVACLRRFVFLDFVENIFRAFKE